MATTLNYAFRVVLLIALTEKLEQLASSYASQHPGSYISAFALFSYEKDTGKLSKLFHAPSRSGSATLDKKSPKS